MTNAVVVLTAAVLSNGMEVGSQCFRVVPDTYQEVVKTCEACRNGWSPLEARCECEYRWVENGNYHLERWSDFDSIVGRATGIPKVSTNYVPVASGGECLFRRVVETNGVKRFARKWKWEWGTGK